MAELGFVFTGHVHRRFFADAAATTVQRRLKRMWAAGWLERCQFFGRDGSAVPIAHWVTAAGLAQTGQRAEELPALPPGAWLAREELAVRQGLHASAWLLALEASLPDRARKLRGAHRARLEPPRSRRASAPIAPDELTLPAGRRPHGLSRLLPDGRRVAVERLRGVRPSGEIELAWRAGSLAGRCMLLLELRAGHLGPEAVATLERYDHLLVGWSAALERFRDGPPLVVFACADSEAARDMCRLADSVLTASRAYAGDPPERWLYSGRRRTLFCAEGDAHRANLRAWRVADLPPYLRSDRSADPILVDLATAVRA
jgi:hypothetical protein